VHHLPLNLEFNLVPLRNDDHARSNLPKNILEATLPLPPSSTTSRTPKITFAKIAIIKKNYSRYAHGIWYQICCNHYINFNSAGKNTKLKKK